MSTIALAAGLALAALFLVVAAAVLFVYYSRFPRRDEGPKMATMWCWRSCWSSTGEKARRDVEKGQTTARVADGPDPPVEPTIKDEPKKVDEENGPAAAVSAVRKYGWKEVENMTDSFSSAVIGEGGFSTVFLARFAGGAASSLGAVKVHRSSSGSERLHRAFRQELEVLLHLRHPHIVRLLGYCEDREEGVLVLEYVPNGTLHEKLHGGDTDIALPWARRMSIALQLARAVEYLHDGCTLPIVHCDLKASNVLLDDRLDCKLCDFGSARAGFESAVAKHRLHPTMMGSPGYVDPHYLRTGIVSKKGDVYSFGVLLLELLTGAEAFCSEKGQMLTMAVGKVLAEGEGRSTGAVIDPRLGGEYDAAEVAAVGALAARCIGEQPSLRPTMAEIVRTMEEALSNSSLAVDAKPS